MRIRLNKYIVFGLFLAVLMVSGYVLGVYARLRYTKAPSRSFLALTSSLSEVSLQVSDIQTIDGSRETTPQDISSLSASLQTSLQTSDKLIGSYKKELNEQYDPLVDAIDKQKQLLEDLQSNFKIVGKAINYNPSLDLGELSVKDHIDALNNRSQAAYDNLSKLEQQNKAVFSEEAINSLRDSVDCFKELADLAKSKKVDQVAATRQRCISSYANTRKHLVSYLVRPYTTDTSKLSQDTIISVLAELKK